MGSLCPLVSIGGASQLCPFLPLGDWSRTAKDAVGLPEFKVCQKAAPGLCEALWSASGLPELSFAGPRAGLPAVPGCLPAVAGGKACGAGPAN